MKIALAFAVIASVLLLPGALADCSFDNATIANLSAATNISQSSLRTLFGAGCTQTYTRSETDLILSQNRNYTNDVVNAINLSSRVDSRVDDKLAAYQDNISSYLNDQVDQRKLLQGLLEVGNASAQFAAMRSEIATKFGELDNQIAARGYQTSGEVDARIATAKAAEPSQDYTVFYLILPIALIGIWYVLRNRKPWKRDAKMYASAVPTHGEPTMMDGTAFEIERQREARHITRSADAFEKNADEAEGIKKQRSELRHEAGKGFQKRIKDSKKKRKESWEEDDA